MAAKQNRLTAESPVLGKHSPISRYKLMKSVSNSISFHFAPSKWILIINR